MLKIQYSVKILFKILVIMLKIQYSVIVLFNMLYLVLSKYSREVSKPACYVGGYEDRSVLALELVQ